jgi:hypothetical protein
MVVKNLVCFIYSYTYIIVSNPQPIIKIIIIIIIMEAQICTTNQSHNYSPTFAIILGLPTRYLGPQVDEPKYEFCQGVSSIYLPSNVRG